MPRATYRTKVLLAMMFVVTAVSVATLVVAQQRVQQNYERMFRSQFQREIAYFRALQEARLGAVKDQCLRLARSIRLIARLNEPDLDAADLYQIAEGELREVLPGAPSSESGSGDATRVQATFFRFLDAAGRVVPPQPSEDAIRPRLEASLPRMADRLGGNHPQQVGYLALPAATNAAPVRPRALRLIAPKLPPLGTDEGLTVHEVVVTKVLDLATGAAVGALVLAFPLPDLVPKSPLRGGTTNTLGLMQWGMLLEGRFFASPGAVPETVGRGIAERLSDPVLASETRQFNLRVDGRDPYRVFCEGLTDGPSFPAAYQVCLYSLEEALREQRQLRWKIIGLGAGGLLGALGMSLFISHGLSAPIRALVAGTSEIQRGNFQVRVPVETKDELGQLAASFNDMAEGLALKEKYRTVLNMVADEKIAQRLIDGELTLGGELRAVTVLFCDIRGFTALTQNMPPHEVIEMLNEHMTALTRVVKEHHGVLDKFVGDLLMAIFGAPIRHGDDTQNAARCALRLMEERGALNRTSRHRIQMGIGLSTGTVVAGCMGSRDRLNYTVLGERVNLASRLCSRAGPGEVLLDDATHQDLVGSIIADSIGDIPLKGFAAPLPVYRLKAMTEPGPPLKS